jgi:hypothetical protein
VTTLSSTITRRFLLAITVASGAIAAQSVPEQAARDWRNIGRRPPTVVDMGAAPQARFCHRPARFAASPASRSAGAAAVGCG